MSEAKAVLTGDLMSSTRAGPERTDRALCALAAAADVISQWLHEDTRFTRFRGDGWQIYLGAQPGLAFRASLYLAARLRMAETGLATRIAAGVGPVVRVGTAGLADASGVAFEISGHALDHMERTRRLVIEGVGITPWHVSLFEVADWMVRRWSCAQAEAVALALNDKAAAMADLAAEIGVTRQAFEARLAGSGLRALETALWAFDNETFGAGAG
jgi:hypothetical protein